MPAALDIGDWLVVAGTFDPLTMIQARRLADLASNGRKLLAVVLGSSDTLLPAEARAELIASLRSVTAVAIANSDDWRNLVARNSRVQLIEDPEGERARTADFVQFVLDRQNA
jgi:hypothetical protein